MKKIPTVIGIFVLSFLFSCTAAPTDRSTRLLELAGQETMQITSLTERLTRQLNIAETQIQREESAKAIETMKGAIETLDKLDKDLDDHTRLAGLVSISELSRAAHDPQFASGAIDRAIKAIRAIDAVPSRCEYVLGVDYEIEQVRGRTDAANFLIEAGPWAKEIKDQSARRQALTAYAWKLFQYENYDAGRDMLRHDTDVPWRADTLVAMSKGSEQKDQLESGSVSYRAASAYGANLGYSSNFKEQQLLNQSKQQSK